MLIYKHFVHIFVYYINVNAPQLLQAAIDKSLLNLLMHEYIVGSDACLSSITKLSPYNTFARQRQVPYRLVHYYWRLTTTEHIHTYIHTQVSYSSLLLDVCESGAMHVFPAY